MLTPELLRLEKKAKQNMLENTYSVVQHVWVALQIKKREAEEKAAAVEKKGGNASRGERPWITIDTMKLTPLSIEMLKEKGCGVAIYRNIHPGYKIWLK